MRFTHGRFSSQAITSCSFLSFLRLSQAYPGIQEKLSSLVGEDFGLDPQQSVQGLEALRSIKAEVIGQERKLKGAQRKSECQTVIACGKGRRKIIEIDDYVDL